jgi:hypothetical protein
MSSGGFSPSFEDTERISHRLPITSFEFIDRQFRVIDNQAKQHRSDGLSHPTMSTLPGRPLIVPFPTTFLH